ncbi:hypothetical protein SUGI_0708350 [Cryptomeria japonica]|nr:hypothetical protein SUGI_0708350 [Cryptomeria japonica]
MLEQSLIMSVVYCIDLPTFRVFRFVKPPVSKFRSVRFCDLSQQGDLKSAKSLENIGMPFQKIERSYYSTPFGWRLATFDETRNGLEKIKEKNLLNKCDRVRLLDGWITGPGYNFKMGNDFKGCLGYILLIRTEASVSGCAYADVNICDTQKEAALFLCADDWNYEVIYWLLNSWTKTDTMDLQDVRQGRIPFIDPTKFKQMNKVVCSLARKLGDNVPVSEKAAKRTYLGSHSGKEVLSNLIKIVNEEDLQQYDRSGFKTTAEVEESCFPRSLEPYWLEHLARQGGMDWNNIADVFLNFLSESFAGSMVEFCGNRILAQICKPEAYFNKVDLNELLRYSLLNGCVYIVTKLFQKGTKLSVDECDDEGKTFVHLAAMGDDDSKAVDLVSILLENIEEKEKLVCNCDRIGRTALHEAALKGNEKLCRYLLDINPKVIDLKDRDGRNPLYDAVHGKQNEEAVLRMLLVEYSRKDIGLDDLRDRNGLTPLHVAASLGKKHLVKVLLSRSRNDSNQYFRGRDFLAQKASAFLKRGDFRGQTALHKAAICGDVETIGILLEEGAHPLNKRDCDGRTALHYAFQAKTGGDKRTLADFLLASCNSYEEKSLLLWASPAGLGTADENLSKDDPIRKFLVDKKREITEKMNTHNLLKTASSLGDTEMSKELVSLGYQIEDIYDEEWLERLEPTRRENVEKVSRQLDIIPERGNDRPALSDDPERIDYARGLAALFLNPYLKPPITVGISGAWGKGKSSLLVQTEVILLTTAAQMALIPSSKLPSSALEFPDMKAC